MVGSLGQLGRQVVSFLEASDDVGRVVVLEGVEWPATGDNPLAGAGALVHLNRHPCPRPPAGDLIGTRSLIEAVRDSGIGHVVLVSSAAVYGAWPDNPVPLTEEATLRPNPGADYAVEKAEVERLWSRWADDESAKLAILRPALVVGGDEEAWLAVALRAATRWGVGDPTTPTQFVHVDDLAAAVALAVDRRLDGVYNVAPEGWMPGAEVRALVGTPIRPPVAPAMAKALARWCWSRGLGGIPTGLVPYATHPWVAAGDRLREAGWKATHSGPEAVMECYPGTPWARLGAKPRRELSLAGGVLFALGLPGVVVALARRRWRRPLRRR